MRKRNKYDQVMEFDNIKLEPEHTILGIVAIPDQPDCSNQKLSKEEIAESCLLYNSYFGHVLLQHRDSRGHLPDFNNIANIQGLENWQHTFNDKVEIINSFITSEDTLIESEPVIAGTWLMELAINDPEIRKAIDEGLFRGLSYGGAGCLLPVNSHTQVVDLLTAEISLVDYPCNKRQWLRKAEAIRKPYVSEFSCRLQEPGLFEKESFRRMSRESGGKTLDIIVARPKSSTKTREQAYRYPVEKWTKASAEAHCKRHQGQFHDIKKEE